MNAGPDIAALQRAFHKVAGDDPALRSIATLLACVAVVQPSQRRQKRKPGRPKNRRAIYVAGAAIDAIESLARCRIGMPRSTANDKPHGITPTVAELFGLLGIKANAKWAVAAALAEREQRRPCSFPATRGVNADQFFERLNILLFTMSVPAGATMPSHDRVADH